MFINTRDVHRQALITSSRIPQRDCSICLYPRSSNRPATKSRSDSLTYTRERSDSRNSSLVVRAPLPTWLASEREVPHPLQVLISHHFQMTPSLRWVFLLALVGCAASIPSRFVDDACVLLCHPRTRSSPEGVCELRGVQSGSVLDQARIIVSRCLKLCDRQLTSSVRASCFALTSFLAAHRECRCSSTDAMRTNVNIPSLVDELAEEVVSSSPLGKIVISALHTALLHKDVEPADGYDLIADHHESGSLAHGTETKNTKQHDVEQPPINVNSNYTARLMEDDQSDTTAASGNSDEDDNVDWEMWCMEQCNNGHGGDACRCDIIPWFSPHTVREYVEEEVTGSSSSRGRAWIYISCRVNRPGRPVRLSDFGHNQGEL